MFNVTIHTVTYTNADVEHGDIYHTDPATGEHTNVTTEIQSFDSAGELVCYLRGMSLDQSEGSNWLYQADDYDHPHRDEKYNVTAHAGEGMEPSVWARIMRVASYADWGFNADSDQFDAAYMALENDSAFDLDRLEEAYRGTFDTFREYADQLADETVLIDVPGDSPLYMYFNWEAFARDLLLGGDYNESKTSDNDGRVHVFDASV